MQRYDIINLLIEKNKFTRYLEIGVRYTSECFDKIRCVEKTSVDPGTEIGENLAGYKLTSDDFFLKLRSGELDITSDYKWDVIFIDGLHLAPQVEKDIINSLAHLSSNGYIILHDCNPFLYSVDYNRMIEDHFGQAWNGTVWKAIYRMNCERPDLDVYTINTDEGVSIIKRGSGREVIQHTNPYYEYRILEKNLKEHLNTISVQEFIDLEKL